MYKSFQQHKFRSKPTETTEFNLRFVAFSFAATMLGVSKGFYVSAYMTQIDL